MSPNAAAWLPESLAVRYAAAIVLGLLASSVHWSGLLVGGILVGLLAPTTGRGIVYGIGWGLSAWMLFVLLLASDGIVPSMATAQLFGVSLGAALALGGLGGTARELRPLFARVSPESGG